MKEKRCFLLDCEDDVIRYLDWLEGFLQNYSNELIDDDWLFYLNMVSAIDQSYMDDLIQFYYFIESYAKQKNIEFKTKNTEKYYYIKYKEFIYEIGMILDKGDKYFCRKVEVDNNIDNLIHIDSMNKKINKKKLIKCF